MKEILILGRLIQIKMCSKVELAELASKDLLGWFSNDDATIYIYSGLDGDIYNRVLLHEITHAMLEISGLSHVLKGRQEEAVCNLMEGYLDLFRNKKFVEYLNG